MYRAIGGVLLVALAATTTQYVLRGKAPPDEDDRPWTEAAKRNRRLAHDTRLDAPQLRYEGGVLRLAVDVENHSPDLDLRDLTLALTLLDCPYGQSDCAIVQMLDVRLAGPVARGTKARLDTSLPVALDDREGRLDGRVTQVHVRAVRP